MGHAFDHIHLESTQVSLDNADDKPSAISACAPRMALCTPLYHALSKLYVEQPSPWFGTATAPKPLLHQALYGTPTSSRVTKAMHNLLAIICSSMVVSGHRVLIEPPERLGP